MIRLPLLTPLCTLAFVATGCGGGDDKQSPTTAAPRPDALQTLAAPDVPFTFSYPGDFASVPKADRAAQFRAIIGLDRLNFLDVRLIAGRELTDAQIEREVRRALSREVIVDSVAREERPALKSVRFLVRSKSGDTPTRSQLNFLRAGAQTWEIGCQSTETLQERIDRACGLALDTLRVTR